MIKKIFKKIIDLIFRRKKIKESDDDNTNYPLW